MAVIFEQAFQKKLQTNPSENLKKAWQQFQEMGLPYVKQEAWRYSPLARFKLEKFSNLPEDYNKPPVQSDLLSKLDTKHFFKNHSEKSNKIIFYNGLLSESLSSFCDKSVKVKIQPKIFPTNQPAAFRLLNYIFAENRYVITVRQNTNLVLVYLSDSPQPLFLNTDLEIQINAHQKVHLIEQHISQQDTPSLLNHQLKMVLQPNAKLTYLLCDEGHPQSLLLSDLQITQHKGAHSQLFHLPLKGELNHTQLAIVLKEAESSTEIYNLNHANHTQHRDFSLQVDHLGSDTKSQCLSRGLYDDQAKGACTGNMHIAQHTQQTQTHFESKNILLSDKAQCFVRPQMSVDYDQVKTATHGATIGKLDENALFYLQSRGLDRPLAKKLLLKAFLNPILEPLKKTPFKQGETLCGM